MSKFVYMALLSAVSIGGARAQKITAPGNSYPWSYDSSSNTVSAPAGSRVAIGTPCPAGAPNGSVCMNGEAIAPVPVSALPAAAPGNANVIQVVSNTSNCTSTSGTSPMLCISTGTAWTPLGGSGGTGNGLLQPNLVAAYTLAEGTGATPIIMPTCRSRITTLLDRQSSSLGRAIPYGQTRRPPRQTRMPPTPTATGPRREFR